MVTGVHASSSSFATFELLVLDKLTSVDISSFESLSIWIGLSTAASTLIKSLTSKIELSLLLIGLHTSKLVGLVQLVSL